MPSEHKGGIVFDYWVANPWLNHTIKPPAVPVHVHHDSCSSPSSDDPHGRYHIGATEASLGQCSGDGNYGGNDHFNVPDVAGDHISITGASPGGCGGPGSSSRAGNQDYSQDFIPSSLSPPAGPDSRRESSCNTDSDPPGPTQEQNSSYVGTPGDAS